MREPEHPIVLHIPHASVAVPECVRSQFTISSRELDQEIARLTDHHTDCMFTEAFSDSLACVFPVSRLVVDPERFEDDSREPMATRGMGVIYSHGSQKQRIRRALSDQERTTLLSEYYRPHHDALKRAVQTCLDKDNACLVLDCHSFPSKVLPYELSRHAKRPQFCLGTDEFHTPEPLVANIEQAFLRQGYSVAINEPFAGCLVPQAFFRTDKRVRAIMIEVNRGLYMNEDGSLSKRGIRRVIEALRKLRPVLASAR